MRFNPHTSGHISVIKGMQVTFQIKRIVKEASAELDIIVKSARHILITHQYQHKLVHESRQGFIPSFLPFRREWLHPSPFRPVLYCIYTVQPSEPTKRRTSRWQALTSSSFGFIHPDPTYRQLIEIAHISGWPQQHATHANLWSWWRPGTCCHITQTWSSLVLTAS